MTQTNTHIPRPWQAKFMERFKVSQGDFTLIACPAAGKTNAAFMAALHEMDNGADFLLFVVPSDSLRSSVVAAAAEWGLRLRPNDNSNQLLIPRGYDGIVATYAAIAANPAIYADRLARHHAFVVMDEVHHAGDANTWGSALTTAIGRAKRRLLMSGTPWRKSGDAIPFAEYDAEGNLKWDFTFTFYDAWAEADETRAVRYIEFSWIDADVHFITGRGMEVNQRLSDCDDEVLGQALRNTYDPAGDWIRTAIREAHQHLMSIRSTERPDAAALLLAPEIGRARMYADLVQQITGVTPVVAVSEDADSSVTIERFRNGNQPWIVAVRQISEGVDIPRLMVEVFASEIKTPLFFHQAVGRVLRRRRTDQGWLAEPSSARVYLPNAQPFQAHASEMRQMLASALKDKPEEPRTREGGDIVGPEWPTLRLDLGNDSAHIAGVSFATGGDIDAAEIATAEAMLGAARYLAADLIRKGVKFPTTTPAPEPAEQIVTDRHDPRELERLRDAVEDMSRRLGRQRGGDYRGVNVDLVKRFGKRSTLNEDACREAIAWLQEQLNA